MKKFIEIAKLLEEITDAAHGFTITDVDNAFFVLNRCTTAEAIAIRTILIAIGYDVQLVIISSLQFKVELI